ncbi:hypothetical protein [Budvicia aquatica]|uniref:Retron-type reverse transcriptase n=1 Tax=Budvicia aquatica TaxID=82979 RepID=A0A484ZN24_9GAMM|nr:hypothetical protein [Budvicia aquatica]VFS47129.1 Uncharacterised protein [Budvicia aquatica]
MSELFSHTRLESAFIWLCQTRKHFPANTDVWHLRFHWRVEKQRLYQQLNAGIYQLSPLQLVKTAQGDTRALWSSPDALVLKCLTLLLTPVLPVHPRCEHIKGHQGGKKSVQRIHQVLRQPNAHFVCRTDIKGYYARINKQTLYSQAQSHVHHPILLNLVWQFLHYSVEDGGTFHTPEFGIARSSVGSWRHSTCKRWMLTLPTNRIWTTHAIWMTFSSSLKPAGICAGQSENLISTSTNSVFGNTRIKPSSAPPAKAPTGWDTG